MLRNLLIVTFRNLQRQKFFAILNISGLAIGLAATLLIGLYIYDELTYDHFHEKLDRIVRVNQTFIWGDTDNLFGSTGPAVRDVLMDEVPEFEAVVRIHQPDAFLVTYAPDGQTPKVFDETRVLAADSNLLSVFTFPLVSGNSKTCLSQPNTVILTQEMARKYFGEEGALGKILMFGENENQKPVEVTGVLEDIPSNSHIDFDFMLSMSSFPRVKRDNRSWIWTTFVTFGLLQENASLESARSHIPNIQQTHLNRFLLAYRGMTYDEYLESGKEWNLYFQPMDEVHLKGDHVWSRLNEVSSMENIYIFGTVAFLILMISMINFINLATARASNRAKEVGIRKVIGSDRRSLVLQFLTESVTYTLVSTAAAVLLAEMGISFFNELSGKNLTFDVFMSPMFLLILVSSSILLGFLGGLYPSFYLTSFQPAAVLKGKLKAGLTTSGIRNTLVILQFTISIVLISSSLIVFDQMSYTTNYDLGFDRSNKIIIKNADRLGAEKLKAYEGELNKMNLIDKVSLSVDAPPFMRDGDNFYLDGQEKNKVPLNFNLVDEDYAEMYDLPILAGRNFFEDGTETNSIIINETAMQSFGYQNAEEILGVNLNYHDVPLQVVGVMRDFTYSFGDIMPAAIMPLKSSVKTMSYRGLSISLKRNATQEEVAGLLASMENVWYDFNSKVPFQYTFLDQEYASLFAPVLSFGKLLSIFSVLAVFIASLGLVGLIAFVIEKRNKEIGIRKILGASMANIVLLLSGQFGKLLGIGLIIAIPLTWYGMNQWLNDFDYRTSISALTFVYAGLIMMAVAMLTTSFQTIRAALVNPVESIKDE
ncbi:MAG: ABC transporter permease [Cyclobacteriaceae bacterium]